MKLFLITVLLISFPKFGNSAACCGGGTSFPSLITGDFKSQTSMSASTAFVVGDVNSNQETLLRKSSNNEIIQTIKFSTSYLVKDYWQVGAQIPIQTRSHHLSTLNESDTGLGDIQLQMAYEYLPELRYSLWKPRGIGFLQLTLPTAPSIHDSTAPMTIDARGRGLYSVSAGSVFLKIIEQWDFQTSAKITYSLPRTFTSPEKIRVLPGLRSSVQFSTGYSPYKTAWRFGAGLSAQTEAPKTIEKNNVRTTSFEKWVWDTQLSLSYLYLKNWSLSADYTDQSLWGPAKNTTLNRTISFQLQYRDFL